jgi:GT2 family glycosyltransferase
VKSPFTLFLNPDASLEPEALRTLLSFLRDNSRVGIVGPATICGADENSTRLQKTGPLPKPGFTGNTNLHPIVPGSSPAKTGWVCGAVFLVRTELMLSLGGFDPRFFLYFEETDVCLRAAQLGFETWAVGLAVARHIGAASSPDDEALRFGCIPVHYYQSRRYYMIKHHGWLWATAAEALELPTLLLQTLADLARGRGLSRIQPRLQVLPFSQPRRVEPSEL